MTKKRILAVMPALALALATALAGAQAPNDPPATGNPQPEGKFLRAYQFRPMLYWGAGLGIDILPRRNELCPGGTTCVGSPVGFGFSLDMGARVHYLVALELTYDAFFFREAQDYYNQATWQSIRLDLKVFLLAGANIEIYVLGGGGVNFFGDKFGVDTTGGGFEAGAGIDFIPAQSFSVGAALLYRGTVFGDYEKFADPDVIGERLYADRSFMHGILFVINLQFRYVIVGAS